jgi:hypothetical protein
VRLRSMASLAYPESCSYSPSDLTIYKMKVVEDVGALTDKADVLRFLLERSRTVETVVAGSLRSALYDLYEAQHWGFASEKARTPCRGTAHNVRHVCVTFGGSHCLCQRSSCRACGYRPQSSEPHVLPWVARSDIGMHCSAAARTLLLVAVI